MIAKVREIGIIGAGTMGAGIAQAFAQKGYGVSLCDVADSQLQKALRVIDKNLRRDVEKNRISEEAREQTLRNIRPYPELSALAKSQVVVEAVNENLELKKEVFILLDNTCSEHTVLASNTSSISITQLAAAIRRPQRVVGMHFMNPVPLMKLVEIIRGIKTSDDTITTVIELVKGVDKVPVEVNDSPGFVSNRILMPMVNEAIFCVYERVGTVEAVDSVMRLGMNHPMGPLALADLIGLDVCLDIMETLYTGFNDSKYRPCPLLKKMVSAGLLGRKSGQGFYPYPT
jgi:3-hydroxybutyryl-CoA dehydrogenase